MSDPRAVERAGAGDAATERALDPGRPSGQSSAMLFAPSVLPLDPTPLLLMGAALLYSGVVVIAMRR